MSVFQRNLAILFKGKQMFVLLNQASDSYFMKCLISK